MQVPSLQWLVRDPDRPSGSSIRPPSVQRRFYLALTRYLVQNTRYVVVSGARKKEEDWDPAENGGFGVIGSHIYLSATLLLPSQAPYTTTSLSADTDSKAEPVDPLAALEKTTDAQTHATKVQAPRLEQLEDLSSRYNDDPYTHSQRVRKRFRAEKKVEQARIEADKSLKNKYGLPAELALERADDPAIAAEARDEWERGRAARAGENTSRKRKLALEAPLLPAPPRRGASASAESAASSLRARLLSNSARRTAAGAGGIDAPIPPTSRKGTGGLAAGIALRKS
jgi:coiled-coil domain-containing protein 130